MEIISHRGNINGSNYRTENSPASIQKALEMGFSVEIDIWALDDELWLGHDFGEYLLEDHSLLRDPRIYAHAKNIDAITELSKIGGHWFWHENDKITLTSQGKIWCLPGVHLPGAIVLDLGGSMIYPENVDPSWFGICTDYPSNFT